MSPRLKRLLPYAGYPAFYFFCLLLFAYWTFPYERLKDRVIAEFEKGQQKTGSADRLEIESIGPYWFSGLVARGVRLVVPPAPSAEGDKLPSELLIEEGHVRLSIFPLLIGRQTITFGAKAFGGTIDGWTRGNAEERRLTVELDGVDIGKFGPIEAMVGLPLGGTVAGKLEFVLPEQKVGKAVGTIELTVADLTAGDGKAKLQGKLALPKLNVGQLALSGEAKDGTFKLEKLAAGGQDLDLAADGKIVLRDPYGDSLADLFVRFKFSDGYKGRNDVTKSLFGAPGSGMPALFELADARIKQSKRGDGFYGWHMSGPLRDPHFDPAPTGASGGAGGALTVPRPGALRGFGKDKEKE